MTVASKRPAEKTGAGGAGATLLVVALGGSARLVGVVGAVAALLPAAVTFLLVHGGLRGIWRSLMGGGKA